MRKVNLRYINVVVAEEEKSKRTRDIWISSREFSLDEGDKGRNHLIEA